jgi:hypothetical protein
MTNDTDEAFDMIGLTICILSMTFIFALIIAELVVIF